MSVSAEAIDREAPIEIKLSEVIGAMSYALDITEGQPQGHAARACMLGMRIGRELGLNEKDSSALFYALLLKDVGCASNASRLAMLFDSRRPISPHRGMTIAQQLQLPEASTVAIGAIDEHWDGEGSPEGLRGEAIPLLARILCLAQTAELLLRDSSIDAAIEMTAQLSGTWFDPQLVRAFSHLRHDTAFWIDFNHKDPQGAVAGYEPQDTLLAADDGSLDRIAQAFSQVVDAKSPWTRRHSEGVAEIAVGMANVLGLNFAEQRHLRRAALLHDVGKLGISNTILDKPGKLTPAEMCEMRKHTHYTHEILIRVAGFRHLAELAASHHERMDGKGYHRGLYAGTLPLAARILAVADMYEALSAKRPYRADLTGEEVMSILTGHAGTGLCPLSFEALKTWIDENHSCPIALAA